MVTAQEAGRVVTGEQAGKAVVSREGSRSERSRDRGRGVWPMTALVLAAAIALPLPVIHQTQGRECVWNGHVFLCRRTADTPPLATNDANENQFVSATA
jgi:hypothetical protein